MADTHMKADFATNLITSSQLGVLILLYCVSRLVGLVWRWYQEYKADDELARQHNCQLPPELPKRWPFGIDRIKEL
ncbi:hypothetical protein NUW58_g1057 [Xylaria curta]|uniref:Uncharacterized protein n=1 Tax=Xylaria curta TaxID=42375 RepID=A0ACC1PLV7_9PEZI|nr:hypothetical protein NUW58_g1057 [Xylaria curta]